MLHDRGVQGGSGDHRGLVAVGVGLAATAAIALAPSVARADEKTERIVAGAVMAPTMALIGGGFALAEKLFSDAADDHLKTIKEPGNSCAKSPDVCQDIDDDLEAVDDARVGEIVCFSASGALLVTGIILIVDAAVGSKKKSSALAAEVQVAPWAGLEGGGAAVPGSDARPRGEARAGTGRRDLPRHGATDGAWWVSQGVVELQPQPDPRVRRLPPRRRGERRHDGEHLVLGGVLLDDEHVGHFVEQRLDLDLERRGRRGWWRRRRRRCTVSRRLVAALAACVALAGCDPGFKPTLHPPGEVTYGCSGFADAACDQAFPELAPVRPEVSPFPPIALGARFGVTGGRTLAPDRLDQVGAEILLARRDGVAPVTNGANVSHFEVRKVASIRVTHETEELSDVFSEIYGEDDFNLRIPDRFRAVPIDSEGHMLAGDLGTVWKSSNPAVVSIESDPAANIVTFRINAVGTADVTVTMGDLSTSIPFDIQ